MYLRRIPELSGSTPPPPPPPPPELKPGVYGIGPRNAQGVLGRQADLGFVVADVYLSELIPVEGGEIDTTRVGARSFGEIERALDSELPVRVRIHTGRRAPEWMKNLGGGPWTLVNTEGDADGSETYTNPAFIESAYLDAYGDAVGKAAKILEPIAQIREVSTNAASTYYGEPMVRGTKNLAATVGPNTGKTNVRVMYEGGITGVVKSGAQVLGPDPKDAAAVLWLFERQANGLTRWENLGFKTTAHYLAFNPFQQWEVTQLNPFQYTVRANPANWTNDEIGLLAADMGPRIVIGNNSLRVPLIQAGPGYPDLYAAMAAQAKAPIGFQTATLARLLDAYQTAVPSGTSKAALLRTLDVGFGIMDSTNDVPNGLVTSPVTRLPARSIELPDSWSPNLTPAECAVYNEAGAANPTRR